MGKGEIDLVPPPEGLETFYISHSGWITMD
jgi:hypothetical protein